ncbi:hypothetical protein MBANPS3_011989 [Mucor bainieri]
MSQVNILFVSIEDANKSTLHGHIKKLYKRGRLARIIFDEVHLSVIHGDWRAAMVNAFTLRVVPVPVLLLSATVPPDLVMDLKIRYASNFSVLRSVDTTTRPDIQYAVRMLGKFDRPHAVLQEAIRPHLVPGCRGLVYANTVGECETIKKQLEAHFQQQQQQVMVLCYYANLETKADSQAIFMTHTDTIVIMVATSAFALGIDLPHIRFVFNMGMPDSILDYAQSSGRAKRSRNAFVGPAQCTIIVTQDQIEDLTQFRLRYSKLPYKDRKASDLTAMANYINTTKCRRFAIHSILDKVGVSCCSSPEYHFCDNCQRELAEGLPFGVVLPSRSAGGLAPMSPHDTDSEPDSGTDDDQDNAATLTRSTAAPTAHAALNTAAPTRPNPVATEYNAVAAGHNTGYAAPNPAGFNGYPSAVAGHNHTATAAGHNTGFAALGPGFNGHNSAAAGHNHAAAAAQNAAISAGHNAGYAAPNSGFNGYSSAAAGGGTTVGYNAGAAGHNAPPVGHNATPVGHNTGYVAPNAAYTASNSAYTAAAGGSAPAHTGFNAAAVGQQEQPTGGALYSRAGTSNASYPGATGSGGGMFPNAGPSKDAVNPALNRANTTGFVRASALNVQQGANANNQRLIQANAVLKNIQLWVEWLSDRCAICTCKDIQDYTTSKEQICRNLLRLLSSHRSKDNSWWILDAVAADPVLRRKYFGLDGQTPNVHNWSLWLKTAGDFVKVLSLLIMMCAGQPPRLTEAVTMKIRNTVDGGHRSVFYLHHSILLIISYNKSSSVMEKRC